MRNSEPMPMVVSMQTLLDALSEAPQSPLLIGYSGGTDSSALLHALASLPGIRVRGLRAVHVDHGMQTHSADWSKHCRDACSALGLPLVVRKVDVALDAGDGPESAARKARYAAFADVLAAGETLALAQHADDQAETVLMKLLRGAGPHGLAGMRERRRFAGGWIWRPWLGISRETILAYVHSQAIAHVEDPTNADHKLARGFLRSEVMPKLHQYWPQATQAIQHSSRLSAAASDYIDAQVSEVLSILGANATLDADSWAQLADALRGPVLERWLRSKQLPAPSTAQRREIERQICRAASDRVPRIAWPGCEVHLWRGRIHARIPQPTPPKSWAMHWDGDPLRLPAGGTLSLEPAGHAVRPALRVSLRQGGEQLRPAGDRHTRGLRDLFQGAGLEPWLRPGCPLIHANGELIAVADLFATEAGETLFARIGARPRWLRN